MFAASDAEDPVVDEDFEDFSDVVAEAAVEASVLRNFKSRLTRISHGLRKTENRLQIALLKKTKMLRLKLMKNLKTN
ncbi:hypothetical protein ACROYT_G024836 [Oculina patagonica]